MSMAHTELLEALRLSAAEEEDKISISDTFSDSPTSAKSIPLDETLSPTPPSEHAQLLESELVKSPSILETELTNVTSDPPTTRTSLTSQVPSLKAEDLATPAPEGDTPSSYYADDSPHSDPLTDILSSTVTPVAFSNVASSVASPQPPRMDRASTTSSTSSLGKKVRPDSLIVKADHGPLILGIALVDFNHSVGPRVEMVHPERLLQDEELLKILPFLALPDGAHQSAEDYSYFHVTLSDTEHVASVAPYPETVFGISCNRQIAASDLLEKDDDVSRSTVQKAVVVLASKPLFGLVRDRLGVVTTALFNQRDFRDTHILVDFYSNLERSMKSQLTESGLYMGTNLRELIHKFRHRTLLLLKLLMLQKRIMFYGHPVERLCTYQYSLVSLIPNLLLGLEDAASPNLDRREQDSSRPTELRTSDRNSLMRYLGLPLNVFGRDSFFQPYLPLQQVDMLKTQSWLCGTTNTIVTQQRDSLPDVLVNIETNTFEFRDPKVERTVGLTAADRRWMDDVVRDVNDGWNEMDPSRPLTMQFKGSDDYLRAKFEDYVSSALASVKYADYLVKTGKGDLSAIGSTGDENCVQNFGEAWISSFRQTHAYVVWNQVTDPALFDICEPRHPCESKPTVISDIGLRLAEGLYDLKVTETVAPAREAITTGLSVASSGLYRAFEGVRNEVAARMARQPSVERTGNTSTPPAPPSQPPSNTGSRSSSPNPQRTSYPPQPASSSATSAPSARGLRPLSLAPSATAAASVATEMGSTAGAAAKATISSWGSFLAKKAGEYRRVAPAQTSSTPPAPTPHSVTVKTDVFSSTPSVKIPSLRSPPLGYKGALWTFGERAEQVKEESTGSQP